MTNTKRITKILLGAVLVSIALVSHVQGTNKPESLQVLSIQRIETAQHKLVQDQKRTSYYIAGAAIGTITVATLAALVWYRYGTAFTEKPDIVPESLLDDLKNELLRAQFQEEIKKITLPWWRKVLNKTGFNTALGISLMLAWRLYSATAHAGTLCWQKIAACAGYHAGMIEASFDEAHDNLAIAHSFARSLDEIEGINVDVDFYTDKLIKSHNRFIEVTETLLARLSLISDVQKRTWLLNEHNGLFSAIRALQSALAQFITHEKSYNAMATLDLLYKRVILNLNRSMQVVIYEKQHSV